MHAVSLMSAGVIAAAASTLTGCAIPTAETLNPFQEPWPWTRIVAVNRTGRDVTGVRAGRCETGPVSRQSQSSPSLCFLGDRPDHGIEVSWNDAATGAPGAASAAGTRHAATVPAPPLWPEAPRAEELTGAYLCVLLRSDAPVGLTVASSAEACAVL
ncbi:hypothetical protein [Cupriavidus neocaledonicus]|uniref:Lipoprotein n=1 Tax=Cupriavidus neocaledonicus TaxID=1040979 RepID=A0A375H9E1_9BURK|nr:hypothetical protein [Cupriavidus neocaledonicus]SOZ34926.1 conserved exported hypothetical protein [Cupriavidus neocaledonicus]SPD46869.1 conserved exported protein of unknown function [Cupriavidus neocaledonicus]